MKSSSTERGAVYNDTDSFHVQWHLTEACNLRCRHCYREGYRRECTAVQRRAIATRLVAFAAGRGARLSVALTGGEPFLVPDVYDLADALCAAGGEPLVSFITNGTVPMDVPRLHALPSLTTVYVSLEGPEAANDAVRGAGAYAAAMRGILALSRAGLRVGVMTTMMRSTVGALTRSWGEFSAQLTGAGVSELILERFVPVGAAAGIRDEVASVGDIRTLYAAIAREQGVAPGLLSGFKALRVMLEDASGAADSPVLYGAVCTSGRDGCAVLCDGTVYPCRRLPLPLGNILDDVTENMFPVDVPGYGSVNDPFGCRAMARACASDAGMTAACHELV